MRTPWTWAAGAASTITAIVACSTPPLPPELDSKNGESTLGNHPPPASSGTPAPTGSATATGTEKASPKKSPTAEECKAKTDADSCNGCCNAAFADLVAAKQKQYIDCLCAPTACKTECAQSRCNGTLPPVDPNAIVDPPFDPTCDACEDGTEASPGKGDACGDATLKAGASDPTQESWTDCLAACPSDAPGADGNLGDGGAAAGGGG